MTDFRGPLPLDDRDFAEVRRNVLAKIERRPVAPTAIRFGIVAAAVAALVFILLPRPMWQQAPSPAAERPRAAAPTPLKPAPPAPVTKVAEAPQRVKATVKRQTKPQQVIASAGPPSDSEITMNIETADPNVRIIWISR